MSSALGACFWGRHSCVFVAFFFACELSFVSKMDVSVALFVVFGRGLSSKLDKIPYIYIETSSSSVNGNSYTSLMIFNNNNCIYGVEFKKWCILCPNQSPPPPSCTHALKNTFLMNTDEGFLSWPCWPRRREEFGTPYDLHPNEQQLNADSPSLVLTFYITVLHNDNLALVLTYSFHRPA